MRFLLLQVIAPHHHRDDALREMTELEHLVDTFGGEVVVKSVQHRIHPHPSTYIGTGKVEWLKQQVNDQAIDVVVINGIAKASQLFRLEKALWEIKVQIAVWDRVDLILNIFERHAMSKEAKLQIELARITHMGPRIYGLGGTVLSRQGGGIGTRGQGETNIELERRIIKDKTNQIKKQLAQLSRTKQQRIRFRDEQGIGPVALVGYTSAGKTTLFNRLTGKQKQAHAGLFTTLDTVVGKMKVAESPLPVLISDTIGFIQNLPPNLIEAFRSTLLESLEAELVLHVVDASDDAVLLKMDVVQQILSELQVTQPQLLVFNKIDQTLPTIVAKLRERYGEAAVCISAHTGEGVPELKEQIIRLLGGGMGKQVS